MKMRVPTSQDGDEDEMKWVNGVQYTETINNNNKTVIIMGTGLAVGALPGELSQ